MGLFTTPFPSGPKPAPRTLRALARLLGYPDAELRAHLPQIREVLHAEGALPAARLAELDALIASLTRQSDLDAEADYVQLFVIPSTHREYAENTFNVRGGCGFSFGNGCSEGTGETSLFGSEKRRTIPIQAEI